MWAFLKEHKFIFIFVALINFLMTPLTIELLNANVGWMVVVNFTLLILAGINMAERRLPRMIGLFFGLGTLIAIWLELWHGTSMIIMTCRAIASLGLYGFLCVLLVRDFVRAKEVNTEMIIGAMAGFLLLGYIGGVLFEVIEYCQPGSISIEGGLSGYTFYYFSFISIMTIGYGDITPLTPQAQAVTILLGIIGQFYMAIGIAVFVGKYLSRRK